jgi:exopolysaccharide production protein ExoQ
MGLLLLFVFSVWLLWILYQDSKERASVSASVWIVLAWVVIRGTRPVTTWFGGVEEAFSHSEFRDEGNPIEALLNLCLIIAGLIVLWKRNVRVSVVIRDNAWLWVFYLFWLLSTLWSDYPIITFKRLFKDLGTVVMVLVILTEREPGEAVRAVFARCAYLLIPLSILLYRYFPYWGRASSGYKGDAQMFVGVTTHKNSLGVLTMVSALFLLWDLLDLRGKRHRAMEKAVFSSRVLVLLMCWYLLLAIDSVTALLCAVLGTGLLIAFSLPSVGRSPGRVEAIGLGAATVLWSLDSVFNIRESFLHSLGRNVTLTSRTDIWTIVRDHQENPLAGAGFDTFWAGQRLELLADKTYGIIQAHNGYLETYLNGGMIGVGLLVIFLFSAFWRIRKKLAFGQRMDSIRFALLLVAIVYNFSEASFNKPGIMWLSTLFACMAYQAHPRLRQAVSEGRQ